VALLQSPTPTGTPPPESLSPAQPPASIPSAATTTPAATEGQVNINFDDVPSPTVITNQYPPAVFSTDSPWYVEAHSRANYGSSFPNYLDRGPYVQPHGYAPLYVDFTTPVNNLKFNVVGADNSTVMAQVNIFQNGTYTTTRNLVGRGNAFTPAPIDLGGTGFDNITRIEIININDPNGIRLPPQRHPAPSAPNKSVKASSDPALKYPRSANTKILANSNVASAAQFA
jgi:hypothetical protein